MPPKSLLRKPPERPLAVAPFRQARAQRARTPPWPLYAAGDSEAIFFKCEESPEDHLSLPIVPDSSKRF